jgi:hypothetical protein
MICEVSAISREERQRINSNVFCMYIECIQSGGQSIQHLLHHWSILITLSRGYSHYKRLPSRFTSPKATATNYY